MMLIMLKPRSSSLLIIVRRGAMLISTISSIGLRLVGLRQSSKHCLWAIFSGSSGCKMSRAMKMLSIQILLRKLPIQIQMNKMKMLPRRKRRRSKVRRLLVRLKNRRKYQYLWTMFWISSLKEKQLMILQLLLWMEGMKNRSSDSKTVESIT